MIQETGAAPEEDPARVGVLVEMPGLKYQKSQASPSASDIKRNRKDTRGGQRTNPVALRIQFVLDCAHRLGRAVLDGYQPCHVTEGDGGEVFVAVWFPFSGLVIAGDEVRQMRLALVPGANVSAPLSS